MQTLVFHCNLSSFFSERCNYSCYSTLLSDQNNFIFSLYIIIESLRAHSGVSNSVTRLDYSLPGSSVHGTFQKECWIELPLPTPRGLPDPGIQLVSPALAGKLFITEPSGSMYYPLGVHYHVFSMLLLSLFFLSFFFFLITTFLGLCKTVLLYCLSILAP